jgi:transposase
MFAEIELILGELLLCLQLLLRYVLAIHAHYDCTEHSKQFMLALLEHSPDLYLDKIQEQLEVQHDVEVSIAAIWRMLKRLGIGSKSVCHNVLV